MILERRLHCNVTSSSQISDVVFGDVSFCLIEYYWFARLSACFSHGRPVAKEGWMEGFVGRTKELE